MQLYNILTKTANTAINKQKNNGAMPSGHNGPYFHEETPIRNTLHWLITFSKIYEFTNDKKYLLAAKNCANYIIKENKDYIYNFKFRDIPNRDHCNGLIGPAWAIDALLQASTILKNQKLEEIASEIFSLHEFNKKEGYWKRMEINGKTLSIDWTFNHQLWFASMGSMFNKNKYPEIHKQIEIFINKLNKNFNIYNNGLIKHSILNFKLNPLRISKILYRKLKYIYNSKYIINKSIGYHSFNLYAFAILKNNYPNINFWNTLKFKKSLNFIETKTFKKNIYNNKFAFPYNVTGVELAYIYSVFKKNSNELQKYWLEQQFKKTFDFNKYELSKNTDDKNTLSARIYEATRVKNIKLDLPNLDKLPFVSIIIPVYNDEKRIEICINKLLNQSYPKDKYEIIIIDNNSTDKTKDIIQKYSKIKLLSENNIQSSYAARNRGIEKSNGNIIAFTDSDCQPDTNWLKEGIQSLIINDVDLVAGNISFIFTNKKDPYEIYDSISNMQQYLKVKNKHEAATGNLFVKKEIFSKIGLFPENVKSGGDAIWTKRATQKKYKLIYENNAKIYHPTRNKKQLLKKSMRVGYGIIPILLNKNNNKLYILFNMIKGFAPPNIIKNKNINTILLIKIYFIKWQCKIYQNIGKINYLKKQNK